MMEKLVSVIIPAYNIERYISRCLDSIMAQTYNNLEIIVIDDGSKDQTAEILDDYQKRDSRIIVVHKENGGVSSARNNGLDIATGDYISFVDGDDLIESNMYEILVKILEKEKTDIAHCGYQMIFPDRVDYYYNTGWEFRVDAVPFQNKDWRVGVYFNIAHNENKITEMPDNYIEENYLIVYD